MSTAAEHTPVSIPPDIPGFEHRLVDVAAADVGSLRLHLVEGGAGDPLLMLHGWPQHFWCWRNVAPALAERFRVICPDLRGFGWSDVPPHGHNPETYAKDALALLDALELERVWVVGHDWGALASLLLAIQHPERVRGVLAMNIALPWASLEPRGLLELRRLWYAGVLSMPGIGTRLMRHPEFVPRLLDGGTVRPGIDPADAALYARRFAEPARARATVEIYRHVPRLGFDIAVRRRYDGLRLTVPSRLILTTGDPAVSSRPAPGWERHVDDLTVEVVEDCGHFTPEEAPELVSARAFELFAPA
jgi:pimeloyl-ACP methyl ester carboxylesterase